MNSNYGSLAVRKRPETLDEVCGQKYVVEILKRQFAKGIIKNVMLLSGHTGCGKTSIARCIANIINNGIGEPIELDCASNNSVDNIRAIVDSANERALVGEYKVFILDEVHMLSNSAWNALLKCIEEPPKYTVFIFCTTERNKVIPAVLNRAQCFNITPLSTTEIYTRLVKICQEENFTNYEKVCEIISKNCGGSMRNAITYLEQVSDYSTELSLDIARKVLGGVSYETFFKLTWAITNKDEAGIFSIIDELYSDGQDLKAFLNDYFNFVVNLLKFILFKTVSCTDLPTYLASEQNPVVQDTVGIENSSEIFNALADTLLEIKQAIKYDSDYKNIISMLLIKFVRSGR